MHYFLSTLGVRKDQILIENIYLPIVILSGPKVFINAVQFMGTTTEVTMDPSMLTTA